jgi:hypothetical protein
MAQEQWAVSVRVRVLLREAPSAEMNLSDALVLGGTGDDTGDLVTPINGLTAYYLVEPHCMVSFASGIEFTLPQVSVIYHEHSVGGNHLGPAPAASSLVVSGKFKQMHSIWN